MSELHSDGIGETGCVLALLLPCPYEPQLLNTFPPETVSACSGSPLSLPGKVCPRRLLTDISTQQLEGAGVSIRVLGGRSTQDLDLESEAWRVHRLEGLSWIVSAGG